MIFSPRAPVQNDPPNVIVLEHMGHTGVARTVCNHMNTLYTDTPYDTLNINDTCNTIHRYETFNAHQYNAIWNCVHDVRMFRIEPIYDFDDNNVDILHIPWRDAMPLNTLHVVLWCIPRTLDKDILFQIRTTLIHMRMSILPKHVGIALCICGDACIKTKAIIDVLDLEIIGKIDTIEITSMRPSFQKRTQKTLELLLKWIIDRQY